MEFIEKKGAKIPKLGFGTWQLKGQECVTSVLDAFEIGYRHIDTAQAYENEAEVGRAITESGIVREDIFLTTKIWRDKFKPVDLKHSLKESLEKLQTAYVDLLLLHWPVPEVPLEETLSALKEVNEAGKARLIGVSNFTVDLMRQAVEDCDAPVVNNQVEYHPYLDQTPVLDYACENGMFVTAYSPIARGDVVKDKKLKEIGEKYGKSPVQVTLRWLTQQNGVAAIPKAASREHAESNFDIFDFTLTDEEMSEIFGLARADGRLISPEWSPKWDTPRRKAA